MSNELQNYYTIAPNTKKYKNPHYKKHLIDYPARMIIIGPSGSGKTNFLIELLHRSNGTFNKIILCCRDSDEPLYNLLKKKCRDQLDVYEIGDAEKENNTIPDPTEYSDDGQGIIIFDDLVASDTKTNRKIQEWFLRGRKVGGGFSCVYLSQSYFAIPKFIRLQCQYIVLKRVSSMKDLTMMLKDFSLDIPRERMISMYNSALKNNGSLLVDIAKQEFRRNFLEIFNV